VKDPKVMKKQGYRYGEQRLSLQTSKNILGTESKLCKHLKVNNSVYVSTYFAFIEEEKQVRFADGE
jgi:hypothetical protein